MREPDGDDVDRLSLLAERGSIRDVAEAFDLTRAGTRSWTRRIGVDAPSPALRRLRAVQALRRMGLYEEPGV